MRVDFSAIIPTFNRAATLSRAIRSVLDQRLRPLEIIVVDDGSTDDTRSVVEAFGSDIVYIYQANGGVSVARNAGALVANSEWIAYLDSDDYWLPTHLDSIARAIAGTEGRASCYFADVAMDSPTSGRTYWQLCGLQTDGLVQLKADASDWAFMPIQPMLLQASGLRRSAFLEIGGLPDDMKTREDTLLFYKLALRYPMCAVAHLGTVMTDDGDARLTRVFDSGHVEYKNATVNMFRRMLSEGVFTHARQRGAIRAMLSDAHLEMAIWHARHGRVGGAMKSVTAAAGIAPRRFVSIAARRVWGRWLKWKGGCHPSHGRSLGKPRVERKKG